MYAWLSLLWCKGKVQKGDVTLPRLYGGKKTHVQTSFSFTHMANNVRIPPENKEGLENLVILHSFQFSIT